MCWLASSGCLSKHSFAKFFLVQDSDDDISHLEWETVRVRLIKAGTLEKLVESLASDTGELESTYVNVFLATYRTFSTASQILALIAKRYADLNQPTVMEAVRLQHKKYDIHSFIYLDFGCCSPRLLFL